ncbi:MAG TPA: 3-hydroxyacyl-ACP dehydratase FabZ [Vicinamibacteria bacterium]|nr:3-hydroxyacyl-ACP dehydratase FabZ [Vicinamibacteria bacterium]
MTDKSDKQEKDVQWILERLPHRYPLLMIDRVVDLQPDVKIVAHKNVTINEEFFQGHFPGFPVMPGVLILEAMAQAGGLLVLPDDGSASGKNFYLASIEHAKFRRTVVPGDKLQVTVTLTKSRANFRRLSGRAEVDGQLAAEAELTLTGVDAP